MWWDKLSTKSFMFNYKLTNPIKKIYIICDKVTKMTLFFFKKKKIDLVIGALRQKEIGTKKTTMTVFTCSVSSITL